MTEVSQHVQVYLYLLHTKHLDVLCNIKLIAGCPRSVLILVCLSFMKHWGC